MQNDGLELPHTVQYVMCYNHSVLCTCTQTHRHRQTHRHTDTHTHQHIYRHTDMCTIFNVFLNFLSEELSCMQ